MPFTLQHNTVHSAFASTARRTPTNDFLFLEPVTAEVYGLPPGAVSWSAAANRVEALREAYAAACWGHGHRVGLLLENRPAFLYHWLALNAIGVSVVPISAEMGSAGFTDLIGHSEIGLVVTLPQRAAELQKAAVQAGRLLHCIDADATSMPSPHAPAPRAGEKVGLSSECALLYTSGTTGRPKGCILDNAYFLRSGEWYATLDGACRYRRDEERVMTPLPLDHVNAMAFSAMVVMVGGGCLVQLDRFHPASWLHSAQESRATIVHYVGVMPATLLSATQHPGERRHAIRWGFGAGVDRRSHAAFEDRFGFPLIEAWATTETGAGACMIANREPRHVGQSCFGRCDDFTEIRLVDEGGADVPHGTPGEMLVRAWGVDARRHFFRGYLKDEEATRHAWEGGWLHTGDVMRRDAQGNLFFVDRKKNVMTRQD